MNCQCHPEVAASAFCQFCGKPLCKDCVHNVAGAVYCEACLAERLRTTGAPVAGSAAGPGFSTGTPHPLLAGLLGFIPGVGAMYNGQYAKAIAHVLIFAVLASLGDKSSIFGILVAAWVFYQVFDAYQTAIARRDGLPLPNPFGLNDIASRLGIHPQPGQPFWSQTTPPPPPSANWDPTPPPSGASSFVPPASEAYSGQGSTQTGYTPVSGQSGSQSYGQPYPPMPPIPPMLPFPAQRDVPVGAIVLIGLGVLFLFGSLGLLHERWIAHGWPLLIIGLGVWIIYRRSHALPPAPGSYTDPNGGAR